MTTTKMKRLPFRDRMVQAVRGGQKTMTRRFVKNAPSWAREWGYSALTPPGCISARGRTEGGPSDAHLPLPYGPKGSRVALCEGLVECRGIILYSADREPVRGADGQYLPWRWKPSKIAARYMPNDCIRTVLEIGDTRVERLNDISEADAMAEGFRPGPLGGPMPETDIGGGFTMSSPGMWASAAGHFLVYFEGIHGAEVIDEDPWLWAIPFLVLEGLHYG